jgi:hypothetical protein
LGDPEGLVSVNLFDADNGSYLSRATARDNKAYGLPALMLQPVDGVVYSKADRAVCDW